MASNNTVSIKKGIHTASGYQAAPEQACGGKYVTTHENQNLCKATRDLKVLKKISLLISVQRNPPIPLTQLTPVP
jgi:hypothetical protein